MADFITDISQAILKDDMWTVAPAVITMYSDANVTEPADHRQLTMYQVGHGIKIYLQPVIIIMGLVCNCFSFLVMVQPQNRCLACCMYLAALAVSDNLMLLVTGYYVVQTGLHQVPMQKTECMLIVYGYMTTSIYGVFVILTMTVERYLATRYPLHRLRWCTLRRARYILVFLVVAVPVYTLPYLFYSRPACQDQLCGPLAEKKNKFALTYSIFNFCFSCVVPFTVLTILNSCIIHTIRNRNRIMVNPSITRTDSQASVTSVIRNTRYGSILRPSTSSAILSALQTEDSVRERQLTTMLLTVSFALLILTAPQYIHHLVYRLTDIRTDNEQYGLYILINGFTDTPFYLNNAINFWLYAISGSKYRQDFFNLFRCKKYETSK